MVGKLDMVGLGYCGLDYLCLLPGIPLDDKVEILESLTQGGGPSATATYAAARLGSATAFASAVGDDERGRQILAGLREGGVDVGAIAVRPGAESPAAFCWIDAPTGKRSIAWTKGAAVPLAPGELDLELIGKAKVLHLDGHQTKAALAAAAHARSKGVDVSIDAGTLVPDIEKLLELCDIVIASEKFAARFTGDSDPASSVRKLFGSNRKFAAVTSGSEGSVGFDGETLFRQAAFPVKVVDSTGAGDVFHGAFVHRFAHGGTWADCLRFAAAVAALKCTKFGGRTGIPTLAETEMFLKEMK